MNSFTHTSSSESVGRDRIPVFLTSSDIMRSGNHSHDYMLRELNILFAERALATSVATFVVMAIGVIGNILVLATHWKIYKTERKQLKDRYFMPYLALADLIACVTGCFMFLYVDFHQVVFTSDIVCGLLLFTAWSTNAMSVSMLLVISVDRYLKICRPFHRQMTLFWKRASLLIITVVSVMFCMPFFHFSGVRNGTLNTTEFADVLNLPKHLQNKTLTYDKCTVVNYSNLLWKLYYNFLFLWQLGNMVAMIFLYVPMGKLIYHKYRQNKESWLIIYQAGLSTGKGRNTIYTASNDERAAQSTDKGRNTIDTASNDESAAQSTDKERNTINAASNDESAAQSTDKERNTRDAASNDESAAQSTDKERNTRDAASNDESAAQSTDKERNTTNAASNDESAAQSTDKERNTINAASNDESTAQSTDKERNTINAASNDESAAQSTDKERNTINAASNDESAAQSTDKERNTRDAASNDESAAQSIDKELQRDHTKGRKPRDQRYKAWNDAKNRFTIMFLLVVIVYAITHLPKFIYVYFFMESKYSISNYFIEDADFNNYNLILCLGRIHLINNIVNPFIYGYFDLTFRRAVKAICLSIFIKSRKACCSP